MSACAPNCPCPLPPPPLPKSHPSPSRVPPPPDGGPMEGGEGTGYSDFASISDLGLPFHGGWDQWSVALFIALGFRQTPAAPNIQPPPERHLAAHLSHSPSIPATLSLSRLVMPIPDQPVPLLGFGASDIYGGAGARSSSGQLRGGVSERAGASKKEALSGGRRGGLYITAPW